MTRGVPGPAPGISNRDFTLVDYAKKRNFARQQSSSQVCLEPEYMICILEPRCTREPVQSAVTLDGSPLAGYQLCSGLGCTREHSSASQKLGSRQANTQSNSRPSMVFASIFSRPLFPETYRMHWQQTRGYHRLSTTRPTILINSARTDSLDF